MPRPLPKLSPVELSPEIAEELREASAHFDRLRGRPARVEGDWARLRAAARRVVDAPTPIPTRVEYEEPAGVWPKHFAWYVLGTVAVGVVIGLVLKRILRKHGVKAAQTQKTKIGLDLLGAI